MKRKTPDRFAFAPLVAALAVAMPAPAQETPQLADTADPRDRDYPGYVTSLRSARDGMILAEDYSAALGLAELVVSEQRMMQAEDLAADLVLLALVLAELDRHDEAEAEFLEAIDRITEREGELSPTLIGPLQLLGRSYVRARYYPEAIAAFEQAQHLSQRTSGLFNVEQVGLIDDLTTAYLGTGDTRTARDLQEQRLGTAQRRFGERDPRVIPFHNELAKYLEQSRLRISAREEYEAVLEILEETHGSSDPVVLAPLRDIARLDMALGEGQRNRERMLEILEIDDGVDPLERGLTLAVLGDWAMVDEEYDIAEGYYAEAYSLIDGSASIDADTYFHTPVMLDFVPPLSDVDRGERSGSYAWGAVEIGFSITSRGRLDEVTASGIEPRHEIEDAYLERLERTHFRPQLVDGRPVASRGLKFAHHFRYFIDEDEEDEEDEEEADEG